MGVLNMATINWFDLLSRYYAQGIYTSDDLKVFVVGNKISTTQYETITGIPYVAA